MNPTVLDFLCNPRDPDLTKERQVQAEVLRNQRQRTDGFKTERKLSGRFVVFNLSVSGLTRKVRFLAKKLVVNSQLILSVHK